MGAPTGEPCPQLRDGGGFLGVGPPEACPARRGRPRPRAVQHAPPHPESVRCKLHIDWDRVSQTRDTRHPIRSSVRCKLPIPVAFVPESSEAVQPKGLSKPYLPPPVCFACPRRPPPVPCRPSPEPTRRPAGPVVAPEPGTFPLPHSPGPELRPNPRAVLPSDSTASASDPGHGMARHVHQRRKPDSYCLRFGCCQRARHGSAGPTGGAGGGGPPAWRGLGRLLADTRTTLGPECVAAATFGVFPPLHLQPLVIACVPGRPGEDERRFRWRTATPGRSRMAFFSGNSAQVAWPRSGKGSVRTTSATAHMECIAHGVQRGVSWNPSN